MGSAYIMVVLGIVLAKGVGFYRDIAFAGAFGSTALTDIYLQVFNVVNLIFAGVGVALSTLVIKNLNKAENKGKEKEYVSSFLKKSTLFMTLCAVIVALFAKPIIKYLLVPNISPENLPLAVNLMYAMAPSLVFVVVAYIISGVLQNEKVFFITSIMSLPFNLIIIASLFIPGVSLLTVGIVTTIGWFLHIAILLPSFFKKGYGLTKSYKPEVKKKSRNPEVAWIFISNMMYQLTFYIDRAFVSDSEGLTSNFGYASNLFIIIASVFVVAMSTVFFPAISKNYEEGQIEYCNETLKYMITVMCAIFLPYLLVVGFFGEDIIRLVYQRGEFSAESTKQVSSVLFIYSFGVLGYVTQELFNKILYLAGRYKVCVIGTVSVIAANIGANFIIDKYCPETYISHFGISLKALIIAVSSSLLLFLYAAVISVAIKKVIGAYWRHDLLCDLLKVVLCGAVAAAVYVGFNAILPSFTHGKITFLMVLCICGLSYLIPLYFTGILQKLIKRKGTKTNEE